MKGILTVQAAESPALGYLIRIPAQMFSALSVILRLRWGLLLLR